MYVHTCSTLDLVSLALSILIAQAHIDSSVDACISLQKHKCSHWWAVTMPHAWDCCWVVPGQETQGLIPNNVPSKTMQPQKCSYFFVIILMIAAQLWIIFVCFRKGLHACCDTLYFCCSNHEVSCMLKPCLIVSVHIQAWCPKDMHAWWLVWWC